MRDLMGTVSRHTAYRATKDGCDEYVRWLLKVGATNVVVAIYKLIERPITVNDSFLEINKC
jgi:hypothetical protein